jgi:uncharacterized protein YbjT (DUF2867 family)
MSELPIVVIGASGNVGSEVAQNLLRSGHSVRAVGQNPAALHARFGGRAEAVDFDFGRPATFRPAFAGAQRVFLIRPPAIADVRRYLFPAIDAAQRAGVRQIVFMSLIGVQKNRIVPHYKVEQYILRSGLEYTFLRPSFFMQNLNTTHRAEIKERSEIYVPAGRGTTSFIDVRDIAAVAALALTEAGHANRAYDLTGAEALDYYQVASQLSSTLGRPIVYRRPSLLQFVRRQRANGAAWPLVAVMAGIYTTARLGLAGRVTGEVPRLLGRAPIPFRQYAEDYKHYWQGSARA